MTYFPVVPQADNRWRKGLTPLRLQNWYVEPLPTAANKPAKAVILPTPGQTARVDLGAPIYGMFAENGVRGGELHAVAGDKLYSISSSWAATEIGTIGGTGDAVFDGLRDALYVARRAKPWRWNGSALTQVTDIDAPDATSFIVLALRILAIEENSDTLFWSATLDGTAWEALGFATAEQRPDIARALVRVSGQALVLGANSIEIHRPTGNSSLPFANVTSQSIEESEGVLGPKAWWRSGDKVMLVGGNNSCYALSGFAMSPLPPSGELEDELEALTAEQRLEVTCWGYRRGSHDFFVVRPPGKPAHVLDLATGLWATRKTWGEDSYLPRYCARAYGKTVVANEGGSVISTIDERVYTDAGQPIERIATLRPGFAQEEAVGSMCIDLQAFDRPLTGQGSAPVLMVDISGDGRTQRDDSHAEVTVDIGPDGKFDKPTLWGLGDFSPGEGATITVRVTDPIGLSIAGAWFNEGQQ